VRGDYSDRTGSRPRADTFWKTGDDWDGASPPESHSRGMDIAFPLFKVSETTQKEKREALLCLPLAGQDRQPFTKVGMWQCSFPTRYFSC